MSLSIFMFCFEPVVKIIDYHHQLVPNVIMSARSLLQINLWKHT
jgi:hypothetical protein